jgi:hypothetical protein
MKPILSASAAVLACLVASGCASSWKRSEVRIRVHHPLGLEASPAKIYIGNKLCFVTTNESSVAYLYPGTVDVKVTMDGSQGASKELKLAGDPEIRQVDFDLDGLR